LFKTKNPGLVSRDSIFDLFLNLLIDQSAPGRASKIKAGKEEKVINCRKRLHNTSL
jgi:hypothetical protein